MTIRPPEPDWLDRAVGWVHDHPLTRLGWLVLLLAVLYFAGAVSLS